MRQDRAEGFGRYTQSDGSCYEGQWKDDQKDGFGQETWPDGSRILATRSWPDGRRYIGNYMRDQKHGKGCFCYANGSQYSGQWTAGPARSLATRQLGELVGSSSRGGTAGAHLGVAIGTAGAGGCLDMAELRYQPGWWSEGSKGYPVLSLEERGLELPGVWDQQMRMIEVNSPGYSWVKSQLNSAAESRTGVHLSG
eukprot:Skav220654  [mRNA]  locus=scaffold2038:335056:339999:+ [translate_table: standard]